jgi:hypothetical protein
VYSEYSSIFLTPVVGLHLGLSLASALASTEEYGVGNGGADEAGEDGGDDGGNDAILRLRACSGQGSFYGGGGGDGRVGGRAEVVVIGRDSVGKFNALDT